MNKLVYCFLFICVLAFQPILAGPLAATERRVALVVGNSDYSTLPALPNPNNDADEVARILRAADFEVIEGRDLSRIDLERLLRRFIRSLDGADVALFYFSGHGIAVSGSNYVVPTDAQLTDIYDLEFETMPLEQVVSYMKSNSKVQLVFLDACRNSPFEADRFLIGEDVVPASATRGLTRVRLGLGTLVAYAAAPGEVALDGTGNLSPFTSAFSRRALTPATEVRRVLDLMRKDVVSETDGRQIPWENSSLLTDFYFIPPKPKPIVSELYEVKVAASGAPTDLQIPRPHQPEGGSIDVILEKLPDRGVVSTGGKTVAAGDVLTADALAGLTFAAPAGDAGTDLIRYRVRDEWGNETQAIVAVSITGDADEAPRQSAPVARAASPVASLGPLDGHTAGMDIGIGPSNLFEGGSVPVAALGADGWLYVQDAPKDGVLYDGTRPLRPGDSFEAKRLENLRFEPQIGTEGETLGIVLGSTEQPTAGESIRLSVKPRVTPCDLLAGQRFDLQGVTAGVFANEVDPDKAGPFCLAAIARYPEVARFFYQLGRVELARGQPDKAIGLIRTAAERGHIRAMTQLGIMTRLGAGTLRNEAEAVRLLEQSVEKGDPFAMQSLAKMLFDGIGAPQDRQRALTLWLQAAEIGHTFSMNALGTLFLEGNGVKKDTARALEYYEASAARGDIYGYGNLGAFYLDGDEADRDYDKALSFYTLAYAGGHPLAANNIGRMYYDGRGVERDTAKAANWYELGAKRGDAYAANNRAYIALNGPDEFRDPSLAAELYATAITLSQGEPSRFAADALAAMTPREKRRAIQRMLTTAGYDSGPTDGIVGPLTRSAAIEFASSVGTTISGVDDRRLILALARAKWLSEAPRFDLF